jgi:hypothetical protein
MTLHAGALSLAAVDIRGGSKGSMVLRSGSS